VHFIQKVTELLEHSNSLKYLMIDFTKAFDSVDHFILLCKLVQFNIPDFAVNSICSFLSDRSRQCKINGVSSTAIDIGLSTVQGSDVGPTNDLHKRSYIVHTLYSLIYLCHIFRVFKFVFLFFSLCDVRLSHLNKSLLTCYR